MSSEIVSISENKDGKELIPSLYTLRAGMSVLSKEKDRIEKTKNKIKEKEKEIERLTDNDTNRFNKIMNKYQHQINQNHDKIAKYNRSITEYEEAIEIGEGNRYNKTKPDYKVFKLKIFFIELGILLITGVIAYFGLDYIINGEDAMINVICALLSFVVIPLGISYFFVFLYCPFIDDAPKKKYKEEKAKYKLHRTKVEDYQITIKNLEESKDRIKSHNKFLVEQMNSDVSSFVQNGNINVIKKTINEYKQQLNVQIDNAYQAYLALAMQFEKTLDKRDCEVNPKV